MYVCTLVSFTKVFAERRISFFSFSFSAGEFMTGHDSGT